jgi:hypothetical protein
LNNLGNGLLLVGELERSEAAFAESIAICMEEGECFSAGLLWAVAEATETRLGMRMGSKWRPRYEQILSPLQTSKPSKAGTKPDATSS